MRLALDQRGKTHALFRAQWKAQLLERKLAGIYMDTAKRVLFIDPTFLTSIMRIVRLSSPVNGSWILDTMSSGSPRHGKMLPGRLKCITSLVPMPRPLAIRLLPCVLLPLRLLVFWVDILYQKRMQKKRKVKVVLDRNPYSM